MADFKKPVRLELNNSGSWKVLGRFDAADDEQSSLVLDAAEDLIKTLHNSEDPKRCVGGRIVGGCSLHDTEKPELCQKHLHRCPEPRTVDCCGVVDEHDIVECSRCGKQWTVPCSFDEDYS